MKSPLYLQHILRDKVTEKEIDWSKVKYLYPVQNENGDIVALCTTKPQAVKIAGPDDEIGVIPLGLINTSLGVAKYTPPTPAVTTYGEYTGQETSTRPSKPRSTAPVAIQAVPQSKSLADKLAADGYEPLDLTTPEDEYVYGQPETTFHSGEIDLDKSPAWGSV
jgi:hypothetical protein